MISMGPTCIEAIQRALTAHPGLWKHDLNIRWSQVHQEWEVSIQRPNNGRTSGGTSGKATGSGSGEHHAEISDTDDT